MPMNKQDLAEAAQKVLGGTKVQAEEVVETLIDTITKALKGGDEEVGGTGERLLG